MTTARDLMISALEAAPRRDVEAGDLSLALAAAELIDLLAAQAIGLDGVRIVPDEGPPEVADRLLAEAASTLIREEPYESLDDWLWRRGRGLSAVYLSAFEAEGLLTRHPRHWMIFRSNKMELVDSADRRHAAARSASDEPVLASLATAIGIRDEPAEDSPSVKDDATATILAAANDALLELEAVRQRRAIEQAAFDNIWRGE